MDHLSNHSELDSPGGARNQIQDAITVAPAPASVNHHHQRRQRLLMHHPYASPSVPGLTSGTMRRHQLRTSIMDNAHGFPYSRKLLGHRACVNALAFSTGDGRFLASGGDDFRILLWDFHQDDLWAPSHTLRGPKGNIFCLAFSASNRYILSGGVCETVYKYDIGALGASTASWDVAEPDFAFRDHDDSIRAITCHPTNDDLFMSASEDGNIIRYDCREPSQRPPPSQNVLLAAHEVTGLQYHPRAEHLFATSDAAGRVYLRDDRMAFGPLAQRRKEGIVLQYNTKLTKGVVPRMCNPESNSIVFDKEGSKLAVTFLHYLPTVYALSDPNPIAVLSGANLPDGNPVPPGGKTYTNSCTMKHGGFGGAGLDSDDMYAAGSDDFRAYVWKLPSVQQLTDMRKEFTLEEWMNASASDPGTVAFSEGRTDNKYVPIELSTPFCRLTGHNSIVNTALFHPHFLALVTAGVEKDIILHSPTPTSPCTQDLEPSPEHVREANFSRHLDEDGDDRMSYIEAMLAPRSLYLDNDIEVSERQTINLFDHIIQEEGTRDVFEDREWHSPTSSDSELEEDLLPMRIRLLGDL